MPGVELGQGGGKCAVPVKDCGDIHLKKIANLLSVGFQGGYTTATVVCVYVLWLFITVFIHRINVFVPDMNTDGN